MTEPATNEDWADLGKLVELVREHRVKLIETKIGPFRVKIHRLRTTIQIDLQEVA